MQYFFLASLLASSVTGLPLNINLGAYSPALVVGDGEISFGGKADVSNLMNALEGAAVGGATAAAAAPAAAAAAPAATPAAAAAAVEPAAAANVVVPETQVTALQGMGKEIAPRIVKMQKSGLSARDITGFNAALKFAAGALTTSPSVQLGTGEGGSGVGITQAAGSAGAAAAAPAPVASAAPKASAAPTSSAAPKATTPAKRDTPRLKTTVTTMFIRGVASPAGAARSEDSSVEKRAPAPALDGVNLNIADGQVTELTFVETKEVDDATEE